jgi:hypothetical protein
MQQSSTQSIRPRSSQSDLPGRLSDCRDRSQAKFLDGILLLDEDLAVKQKDLFYLTAEQPNSTSVPV